ncbi:MAG: hypothetical protein WBV79_07965, partial [Rhodomicrobium sp.]
MDGIHDMGGMDGFGRVEPESEEPVFHENWEGGPVFALQPAWRCRSLQRFDHSDRQGSAVPLRPGLRRRFDP